MTGKRTLLFAALVALLQIGFLGWMIQGRASILQNGREVLLRVKPVDPRDLLRGDYVRLGYDAGEFNEKLVVNRIESVEPGYGNPVIVRLARQETGHWMPVSAYLGDANPTPAPSDQVDIKATTSGFTSSNAEGRTVFVDYGIERFYVPEGEGLAIQNDMRERPFSILAAVDDNGAPQIKGLMDGDKMLYAEPLY